MTDEMPRKSSQGLPTRQQILDFIESSGQPAGKSSTKTSGEEMKCGWPPLSPLKEAS